MKEKLLVSGSDLPTRPPSWNWDLTVGFQAVSQVCIVEFLRASGNLTCRLDGWRMSKIGETEMRPM